MGAFFQLCSHFPSIFFKQPSTSSLWDTLTTLNITLHPKTRCNEHTSDFFPDKAAPTPQLMSLLLSTKTCHEIFNPCSQTLPFFLQINPKNPRPLPQGVMQARVSYSARDGMRCLPVSECSRLCVPGWPGRHLTSGQRQPRAGGSQWHCRAALLCLEVSPGTGLPRFLWPPPGRRP